MSRALLGGINSVPGIIKAAPHQLCWLRQILKYISQCPIKSRKLICIFAIVSRLTPILLLLFVNGISIAQVNSLEFHNKIVSEHSRIDVAVSRFNEGIVLFDGDTILADYKNLLAVTEKVIAETEKIKLPESGAEYHKAALDLFRFYLRTFENDYYDAVAIMYRIPITDADIEEMERLFDRVELKESIFLNAFFNAQIDFCEAEGIEIE